MANISGHWAAHLLIDEEYLAAQIAEHGIEQVCTELHDQNEGKFANDLMIEYTRKMQEQQIERMKRVKAYFNQLVDWTCEVCKVKNECEKYKLGIKYMRDGLAPLAVGTLHSCPLIREVIEKTMALKPEEIGRVTV